MSATSETRGPWATIATALCGLWLLAGAIAKLFWGTPKDLPAVVIAATPLGLDLTFHLVIAIELVIVSLCWLRPRLGWPIVLALFAFFDFVLTRQLAAGAESCGCFGATIEVSPWLMLALDTGLALGLLLTRPWANLPRKAPPLVLLALAVLLSASAPWIFIPAAEAAPSGSEPAGVRAGYTVLEPARWVGRSLFDLAELKAYAGEEQLPIDGIVVLWRQSCDHCAAHLRALAQSDDGTRQILLLQVRDDLGASRAVDLMPQGSHVSMAATPEGREIVVETPFELFVEGGTVTRALDPREIEAADAAAGEGEGEPR